MSQRTRNYLIIGSILLLSYFTTNWHNKFAAVGYCALLIAGYIGVVRFIRLMFFHFGQQKLSVKEFCGYLFLGRQIECRD